jgi:protease-4
MTDRPESPPNPSVPPPVAPPQPGRDRPAPMPRTAPPAPRSSALGCAFALSFALNILAGIVLIAGCFGVAISRYGEPITEHLRERHYSGKTDADDKVAIISLEGVIVEGLLSYTHKQIDQAARDSHVKAVVLRIVSPGGSITASDELHQRLTELRDGNPHKKADPKPLVVSMGSLAASGGYYVAMPAPTLFAERTTLTGSIGVYTAFPNVKQLGEKIGVSLTTIKQGQIKDSGSPFNDMTRHERQVWQEMVNDAYRRFLHVVEQGRPMLRNNGKAGAPSPLLVPHEITPVPTGPDFLEEPAQPYKRYLADGGVWTAEQALRFQLVDKIGSLDDAVTAAHDAAGLGENYRAIQYERPKALAELLGLQLAQPASLLEPGRLEAGLMPRLWYLAPGAEAAGFVAAAAK